MKTFVSPNGDLNIRQNSFGILIGGAIFGLLGGLASGGIVWSYFHKELFSSPTTLPELAMATTIGLFAIAVMVLAFWFAPFRSEFTFSADTISVVERGLSRSNRLSYRMSDLDRFSFIYFLPRRSFYRSATIRMNFRSGTSVPLLTLPYISRCQIVHSAMKSHFSARGLDGIVGELPE